MVVEEELLRLVRWHGARYPHMGPEDWAKLLYQGVMGMDHLLADRPRFLEAFFQEWDKLGEPLGGEPLFDPVSLDWRTVRVHLRGAKARGWDAQTLAEKLAAQPLKQGQLPELLGLWDEVLALARAGRLPFPEQSLATLGTRIQQGHVPRHSPEFQTLYRPAYRLVHDVRSPWITRLLLKS